MWEGVGDRTELQYFCSHSYVRQRCVFLVFQMLNRRPRGPLCRVMAFFTAFYQQTLWTPTQSGAPSPFGLVWLSLPHLVYNSNYNSSGASRPFRPDVALPTISRPSPSPTLTGTVLTFVLTELYNSSTPTQSSTRSLKSHVWSSSSGNNCHAVHRSLSSGASVYECTMGIFLPRPISSANFRPRDFLP